MIKNQKQAGITKGKLAELKKAKEELASKKANYDPIEYELAENAVDGLIEDLKKQLHIYQSLVNGKFHCLKPENIEDIPNTLIAARLAQKISQRELADKLGIQEQQVQRYEASDFEGASWSRIVEFANALDIQMYFEKIVIINIAEEEEKFEISKDYSDESIIQAEVKIKRQKSLIFV